MTNYAWGRRTNALTDEQAAEVIRDCTRPEHEEQYATRFGVCRSVISNIRLGKTYWRLRMKVKGKAAML